MARLLFISLLVIIIFITHMIQVYANNCKNYNLSCYSFSNSETINIPVREASGIACDYRNNLLYVHEDSNNDNIIYVLNQNGILKHTFNLNSIKNNDWEDITTDHNGTFWIIDSRRYIHQFKTDTKGYLIKDSVKTFTLPKELLKKNIESIDYIATDNSLILILKGNKNKIYKLFLNDFSLEYIGLVPEKLKLLPSGLTHNPKTNNFFLLSFWGSKIVEFSPDFKSIIKILNFNIGVLFTFQPEGIEFDKDSNLLIVAEKPWNKLKGKSKLIKLFYNKNETAQDK
ncbi:MAG: SdiA-regulated domain-containing protein [Cyanobacteriota bacterium]